MFLPGKGASRARTEGEKAEPCIVPILPQIRPEIDAMRERKGWLILSSRGSRYTAEALGAVVSEIATAAKVDRHLHDARGTFATYMMTTFPELSDREVALMMDWSEKDVARIRRIYVSGSKIAKAMIERVNWNRK